MKNKTAWPMLQLLALLGGLLGMYVTVSSQFVRADTFDEFKEGTVNQIMRRLDSIDAKLDKILSERGK